MNELDTLRDILLNLETAAASDPYSQEVMRERLIREMRKHLSSVIKAVDDDSFTPSEVLSLSSVTPDYVSLSGNGEIVRALEEWVERNRERENTTEVRLYTKEAEKMLSSLCF